MGERARVDEVFRDLWATLIAQPLRAD